LPGGLRRLEPADLAMLFPAERSALVNALAPHAADLCGRRILLTGATGFFGRWLLEALLALEDEAALGCRIFAQSRAPEAFARASPALAHHRAVQWLAAHPAALQPTDIPGGRVDAVIHLVTEANAAVLTGHPTEARRTIVDTTRAALRVATVGGATRFLFTSSGSVYERAERPVVETDPLVPRPARTGTVHAIGGALKREAEDLCLGSAAAAGSSPVVARCFAFLGPHLPLDGKFAVGNFMADALHGRDITLTGDGRAVRSYLYASDLATWLLTLLLRAPAGGVYNVGSPEALPLREVAERIRALVAPSARVCITGAPTPGVDYYVPDVRKAERELGLVATVPLDEAIRRTAAWARMRMRG
jgi:dTDP-glucose 4,6-dehydratase